MYNLRKLFNLSDWLFGGALLLDNFCISPQCYYYLSYYICIQKEKTTPFEKQTLRVHKYRSHTKTPVICSDITFSTNTKKYPHCNLFRLLSISTWLNIILTLSTTVDNTLIKQQTVLIYSCKVYLRLARQLIDDTRNKTYRDIFYLKGKNEFGIYFGS